MKKITLLIAIMLGTIGFSQTFNSTRSDAQSNTLRTDNSNSDVISVSNYNLDKPTFISQGEGATRILGNCDSSNPSFGFENGRGCSVNNNQIAANDIIVEDGMTTTLNTIIPNIFMSVDATASSVDVMIYDDADGLPGALVTEQLGVVPTSQTVIGSNFNLNVNEVVMDLEPIELLGAIGTETTYWVGIQVTTSDGGNAFWEDTTNTAVGVGQAYNEGAGWVISVPGQDGVYVFDADCDILGVSNFAFKNFTMFPNPTGSFLNLDSTNKIEEVIIFNITGQKIFSQSFNEDNAKVDVTAFASGAYIINVTIDGVKANYKFIKE